MPLHAIRRMTLRTLHKYTHPNKDESRDEVLHIIGLIALIYFIGIFIFHNLEGWNYLDSAYFVTATVLTIGYGDMIPHTDNGKIAAIIFGWLGVSTGFYLLLRISDWRKKHIDVALVDFQKNALQKMKRSVE